MAEHPFHDTPVADGCYVAGGAGLFASAFLYWVARGPGNGLRGHALVDTVAALGQHVPALSAGRLTILWYLVPAIGAASWVAVGITGSRSRASRIVAGVALLVTAVVGFAFIRFVGLDHLGAGPKVAMGAAVVLCLAAWSPRRSPVSGGRGSGPSP